MTRRALGAVPSLGLAIVLIIVLAPRAAGANPSQDVVRARGEFYKGNYQEVIAALEPQLYPKTLISDEKELAEAHYLLAEAYYYAGNREKARREFVAILFDDPEYRLDPVVEETEIYTFFETIRQGLEKDLEEILRRKREQENAAHGPTTQLVIERVYHDQSSATKFMPFGIAQFKNGDRGWGYFFLAAQSVTLGTSATLFLAQWIQYGWPSNIPPEDESSVRSRQVVQVVSGALFLALYGIGVGHAFYNWKPSFTETRREVPIEKPKTSFVVPLLTPDTVGVGVTWEF